MKKFILLLSLLCASFHIVSAVAPLPGIDTIYSKYDNDSYTQRVFVLEETTKNAWSRGVAPTIDGETFPSWAKSVRVNAYHPTEDRSISANSWFVYGPFDLSAYDEAGINFYNKLQYKRANSDAEMLVKWSSDYAVTGNDVSDIATATWTDVTSLANIGNNNGTWTYTQFGVPNLAGNNSVYVAFQFLSTTAGTPNEGVSGYGSGHWELFSLGLDGTVAVNTPLPSIDTLDFRFSDDPNITTVFSGASEDNLSDAWTRGTALHQEELVEFDHTVARRYRINNLQKGNNSFVTPANAHLVIGPFDFSQYKSAGFSFWNLVEWNKAASGAQMSFKVSTDYVPAVDSVTAVANATWVDYSSLITWDPQSTGSDNWTFNQFALPDLIGMSNVYVDFNFVATAAEGGAAGTYRSGHWDIFGLTVDGEESTSTSIDAASAINYTCYPNPVNDILRFNFESNVIALELLDMTGKVLTSYNNITTSEYSVNLSNLYSGVLFVRLTDDKGNSTVEKIIKK